MLKWMALSALAAVAAAALVAWAVLRTPKTPGDAATPAHAVARLAAVFHAPAGPATAPAADLAAVLSVYALTPSLASQFPLPDWDDRTRAAARQALDDQFTFQGVTAKVPRLPDEGLDWNARGPNHDPEFAWFLNRLLQVPQFFVAWRETGDARYRRALNDTLQDWITHNPRPAYYSLSSSWRALEAARRAEEAFLPVLYAPQAAQALDPATRVLMLASLLDHAECLRYTHAPYGNHLLSEMGALAAVALACPQFQDAPAWLDYALTTTRAEMAKQFYPDGAHTELANHYQLVVLQSLQHLADVLAAAGRTRELATLRPALEQGWDFYAYEMDPKGEGPLDNDSDIGYNYHWLQPISKQYGRDDWRYLATFGAAGQEPAGLPSRYFPWAGQAVLRGGWQPNDQWAFFESGPNGTDHQHADRLQLDITAENRDFLVDNGRYVYDPGPWRDYFAGPTGHNILLLDGRAPLTPPNRAPAEAQTRHDLTPAFDFVAATADFAGDAATGQGPAYQTRAILYARKEYWIVIDRILTAGGPRPLEALWHFHPDCTVRHAGDLLYTDDPAAGNFGMLAVNPPAAGWAVELVRGRASQAPQGWYSAEMNERRPATCAEFTTTVAGPHTFVWLMWTEPKGRAIPGTRPQVQIVEDSPARLRLHLTWPDGHADDATVPFTAGEAPAWLRATAPVPSA